MKNFIRLAVVLAFVAVGASAPRDGRRFMVKVDLRDFHAHRAQIHRAGIDVGGVNIPHGYASLILQENEVRFLESIGVRRYQVFRELSTESPDPKFKKPEQVAQVLQNLQQTFPNLAQVASIGKSLQGRDILAIKITSNVHQFDANKPAVLFNGMHHAREVMATEVPLDIAEYLLSNYGKDAQVTHWLDTDVIYVVPMLNVDGNNIVWTSDNMWRKNARGNFGVDINRNYPFQWNSCNGSSGDTGAQDYRGPSAASEPETNVLMSFVHNIHPVFDISFHSYSELVIYPYGCGQHTETPEVVEPLGQQMASLIPNDAGDGHYTAGLAPELLYMVDGDDIDWMYHEEHVIPYVIELNSDDQGFQPGYDEWRDKTVTKLRPAWQLLLTRLDHASIRGTVKLPELSLKSAVLPHVHVERVNSTPYAENYPIRADGTFNMILNPGNYRLTFSGPGIATTEHTVHVGNTPTKLDLDLAN